MARASSSGWSTGGVFAMAVGLAVFFAVAQALLFFATGFAVKAVSDVYGYRGTLEDASMIFLAVIFLWTHALFVLLVTEGATPKELRKARLSSVLIASVPLMLVFLAIAALDSSGANYSCAEGRVINAPIAPALPWAWIGWFALVIWAFPARLLAWATGQTPRLAPLLHRIVFAALISPIILIFGYPFEVRVVDCTLPHEGWGFFEGGAVMIPLLGLFLFSMVTSLAMLSGGFSAKSAVR